MRSLLQEPYKLFFPLGILYGLWGVSLWILFSFGWLEAYPGILHSQIMIGGFLGSFATGFLMTAVPKFTQTYPLLKYEFFLAAFPLISLPLLASTSTPMALPLALLVSLVALVSFAIRRFLSRQSQPPPSFMFLGVGLASAIIGLTIQVLTSIIEVPADLLQFGRLLYFYCFMLSLLIGVGCRLIPVLLGWSAMPVQNGKLIHKTINTKQKIIFSLLALLLVVSFAIEAFYSAQIGRWLRSALVSTVGLIYFKSSRFPLARTRVAWTLWLSCWFIIAGSILGAAFPSYYIHFIHLVLLGGLAQAALMIATRVILVHGGWSLALETKLSTLSVVAALVSIAALLRAGAGFNYYLQVLNVASVFWILSLLLWMCTIGWRALSHSTPRSDQR